MLTKILTTATATTIASVALASPAGATLPTDERAPRYRQAWLQRPCQYEDSTNCYWNAHTRGDGAGHSFYAIPLRGNRVAIVYWNRRYNAHHSYVTTDPYGE